MDLYIYTFALNTVVPAIGRFSPILCLENLLEELEIRALRQSFWVRKAVVFMSM